MKIHVTFDTETELQDFLAWREIRIAEREENIEKLKSPKERANREMLLAFPIYDAEFSVRTYNVLTKEGVVTIGDLLKYKKSDLKKLNNLGARSLREITEYLEHRGLFLEP